MANDLFSFGSTIEHGTWAQIPGSAEVPLITFAESRQILSEIGGQDFWGNSGVDSVFTAWNSAAYDPIENEMYFWGGGHKDYGGNEVYQFDFDSFTWTRLTDPAALTVSVTGGFIPDGNSPAAPHTYDGVVWNPVTETMWWTGSTAAFSHQSNIWGGAHQGTWEFDPDTGKWVQHVHSELGWGKVTQVGDGSSGQLLQIAGDASSAYIHNPDGSRIEIDIAGDTGFLERVATLFTDPVTGKVYSLNDTGITEVTLLHGTAGEIVGISADHIAGSPTDLHQAGVAYRPVDGNFYIWNGGNKVTVFDPTDHSIQIQSIQGHAPSDGDQGNGRVFEKWVYLEEIDSFAGIASADGGMWIFKPGDSTGGTAPVGTAPVVLDDDLATEQATAATLDVLANDTDVDGDALNIISVNHGSNGAVVLNPDGTVTYTPNEGFSGEDSFTYLVSDGHGNIDQGTVNVTVNGGSDPAPDPNQSPPEAADDSLDVNAGSAATINVLFNDSDSNGDSLKVMAVSDGSNGATRLNANGTITYTPNEGFSGQDSFSYSISDGAGGTDSATVQVAVAGSGNGPSASQTHVGTVQLDPATAHTLSFVLPTTAGDDNDNGSVEVFYRKAGSSDWQQSIDFFQSNNSESSPYSGMIMGLDEGTTYEVKLVTSDPDGVQGASVQTLTAATREIPVVADEAESNTIEVSSMAELQAAVDTAVAGDLILLAPGTYQGELLIQNRSGEDGRPITIRGADGFGSVIDAGGFDGVKISNSDYIHIEGLKIENANRAIEIRDWVDNDGTIGNTIRGNLITDVTVGINARGNGRAGPGHNDLYIVDNTLRGTNQFGDTSNATWDDEGIAVVGEGIEIAYNTVSGFGDSLGLWHSDRNRGIDIHHNLVEFGGDDGIELDFSDRNVTAHHNLITNTASGISFQYVNDGPAYAYQNVLYNIERDIYKIKPEAQHNDGIFIINNTSINGGRAWLNNSGHPDGITFLNNLFTGSGLERDVLRLDTNSFTNLEWQYNAYTYDGYFQFSNLLAKSFADWSATSIGEHDLLLQGETVFAQVALDFDVNGFGVYRDPEGVDFSLDGNSSAVDAGRYVPGINDGFVGLAPDIGAVETGTGPTHYGSRLGPDGTPLPDPDPRPNTAPGATGDAATTGEGEPIVIDVLANDVDADGDLLTVTSVSPGASGAAAINADGTITYTPNPSFSGSDSFDYIVSDGKGGVGSATVTVTVVEDPDDTGNFIVGGRWSDVFDFSDETDGKTIHGDRDATESGHDVITGSQGDDSIFGGKGQDRLAGESGDDLFGVDGHNGFDYFVYGGDGFDILRGSPGDDIFGVWGARGAESLSVERIEGGEGYDVIRGYHLRDFFDFSDVDLVGIELIDGGGGYDRITASQGDDTILGGTYPDVIIDGHSGTDTVLYHGTFVSFTLSYDSDGNLIIADADGNYDTLKNVEILQFSDGRYVDGQFLADAGPSSEQTAPQSALQAAPQAAAGAGDAAADSATGPQDSEDQSELAGALTYTDLLQPAGPEPTDDVKPERASIGGDDPAGDPLPDGGLSALSLELSPLPIGPGEAELLL